MLLTQITTTHSVDSRACADNAQRPWTPSPPPFSSLHSCTPAQSQRSFLGLCLKPLPEMMHCPVRILDPIRMKRGRICFQAMGGITEIQFPSLECHSPTSRGGLLTTENSDPVSHSVYRTSTATSKQQLHIKTGEQTKPFCYATYGWF